MVIAILEEKMKETKFHFTKKLQLVRVQRQAKRSVERTGQLTKARMATLTTLVWHSPRNPRHRN